MDQIQAGNNNKLANLKRAAQYPWRDDGRCAVQESSGDWATLVEKCYGALDLHRIRFVDHKRVCPIAQAGVMSAEQATQLVGICLLVQPEVAIGVVIVIGAIVVAAAIVAEIEAVKNAKRPCIVISITGTGTGAPPQKPGIYVLCTYLCGKTQVGPLRRPGTSHACYENIPTY